MDADQKNDAWRAGPGVVAALTLIGIVTGLGTTRAVGCVIVSPWINARLNILLSVVMLMFACMSVVISRRIALNLMALEFAGFVLLLFFLRGGYAVGFSGAPSPHVVEYDALSVAVRIGVLGLLFSDRHPSRRVVFTVALLGIGAALAIVRVKATLFRLPIW
jgi:hypothetical protein